MIDKIRIYFERAIIRVLFSITYKSFKKSRKNISKPRLFWGITHIINFKYWNEALRNDGYDSKTVMSGYSQFINKKEDYDLYIYDILSPLYLRPFIYLRKIFPYLARIHMVFYIVKNFDIIHTSYDGLIFKNSNCWKDELLFYKKTGMKIVALPYGSDYQRFSKLYNKSWNNAIIINYPENARREKSIDEKIDFFTEHADCIMAGFQYDQVGRWDILPYAIYPMDCNLFKPKQNYTSNDGTNGTVKVYHTPNHRGLKGTEFLIEAVDNLKAEGLLIELVLLEKVSNEVVRQRLHDDADILVEQLILGYALSALEGISSGLTVITALEDEMYSRVFRRYSYLNECPMLSSSPEKIKDDLRILVRNPELRKTLGMAGRKFAEKYHSYDAMATIFNAIYDKIWYNKPVDLINFFNPQNKESYNNRTERIKHPLHENKIPAELMATLNK